MRKAIMSHFHRNEERHRLKLNKGPCNLLSDVAHIRSQTAAAATAGINAVERIEEPGTGKTQNNFRHYPKSIPRLGQVGLMADARVLLWVEENSNAFG
jgi:hypothetical protein